MAELPPQRDDESAKAYAAFTSYCLMGSERSTAKLQQEISKGKRLFDEWSRVHEWQARVREYDAALAAEASAAHTARYLADLEDHRKRYSEAGRGLYTVAGKMLKKLDAGIVGLEMTPQTLGILLRAFQTAADLEAHALGLDEIMPRLADDSE